MALSRWLMRELGGRRAGPSEQSAALAGSPPLSRALFPVGDSAGEARRHPLLGPPAPQPPEALRGAGAVVAGTEPFDSHARFVLCKFPLAGARRAPLTRQEAGGEAPGLVDCRNPQRRWTFPSLWSGWLVTPRDCCIFINIDLCLQIHGYK